LNKVIRKSLDKRYFFKEICLKCGGDFFELGNDRFEEFPGTGWVNKSGLEKNSVGVAFEKVIFGFFTKFINILDKDLDIVILNKSIGFFIIRGGSY
jgi:hypothetical protein